MAVKAILFDFWGTLAENGIRSPVKQVKWILRLEMDFKDYIVPFEESFMTQKFDSLKDGFVAVCNKFKVDVPDFVVEKLIGMWNKNTILSKPYDETVKVLEDLKKDFKLVLVINTDAFSVEAVLDKFDLKKYFDFMALSYKTGFLKTNPKMFKLVLKELKLKKNEVVMVGDSMESDIRGAEAAGIKAILIDRKGDREYENKISSLEELRAKLE